MPRSSVRRTSTHRLGTAGVSLCAIVVGQPTGGSMSYTPTVRSPSDDARLPHRSPHPVACYPGIRNGAHSPMAGCCRWSPCRGMPQLHVSCSTWLLCRSMSLRVIVRLPSHQHATCTFRPRSLLNSRAHESHLCTRLTTPAMHKVLQRTPCQTKRRIASCQC